MADKGIGDIARGARIRCGWRRVGELSEVVVDLAQGVEMLATSDDIQLLASVVGLMGKEDLDRGLQLARVAGELEMASRVASLLEMPILSDFLGPTAANCCRSSPSTWPCG